MKYTIKDFQAQFPNDDVCLDYIFNDYYGKDFVCKCGKFDCFYRTKGRKSYTCSWCGYQINPTANTIFHKSPTKLTLWFYAMFLMSQAKNGVSAKELERHLGVTYKTAWRIAKQIRILMEQKPSMLSGHVEADETYFGGKGKNNKRGRGAENKTPIFGLVERQGNVKAQTVENCKTATLMPIICENVEKGATLMTDEFQSYNASKSFGFAHEKVRHSAKEYVRGLAHTNTLEGFWSQLKRSIDGTFHKVSPKYLQSYVNEVAWKYNHRKSDRAFFHLLLEEV